MQTKESGRAKFFFGWGVAARDRASNERAGGKHQVVTEYCVCVRERGRDSERERERGERERVVSSKTPALRCTKVLHRAVSAASPVREKKQ